MIRLLWVTNVANKEVSLLLNKEATYLGGWLTKTSKLLSNRDDFFLSMAFPAKIREKYQLVNGEYITYFPFKKHNKCCKAYQNIVMNILIESKPDLVHIHGTELPHTLAFVNACNKLNIKFVISIQGLISEIEKQMFEGLNFTAKYFFTFRNIVKHDNVYGLKKIFRKRGKYEVSAIQNAQNIIGRTEWDKTHILAINSKAIYYKCNETLRDSFYNNFWSLDNCIKQTIFVSQGEYSIKGLHYIIIALSNILKVYPDVKLYISGKDITNSHGLKKIIQKSYYGVYIKNLIKKFNLSNNVIFTGPLSEKEMVKQYLSSNVFACPSTIENSPNSLGEAMLLGVPCVASYVGGIPDMLRDKIDGFLYQHNDPYMMASFIKKIFADNELSKKLSESSKNHANITHNINENLKNLVEIYHKILDKQV